jgi:hypothetical protein
MNLAFLILAHKNPEQLQLLVEFLHRNNAAVFIHIDRKNKDLFSGFVNANRDKKNVFIYTKYKVYWGGYSQIKATLFLLNEALSRSPFDFVSLLSGQDAPTAALSQFSEFLKPYRNSSFVHWHKVPAHGTWDGNGGLDRVNYFWVTAFPKSLGFFYNRLMVVVHAVQRRLKLFRKFGLPLFGGANWFTLNKEMAVYVSRYVKDHKGFFRKFRFTRCADEMIIQTILLNSPYREDIVNDTLRLIDWETGPEYPRIFRSGDTERLLASGKFFARKFDTAVDREVLEKLYRSL